MPTDNNKLRVLCFGYNGANNTGSEAKLRCTLRTIKNLLGDRIERLTVLTINEQNQRRYLTDYPEVDYLVISPWILFKYPQIIWQKGYDVLFLSEGSTFIDHFSSVFLWMFCGVADLEKLRGHKVVAYANDCGHLKPMNQKILKRTANKFDLIMLRNPDAASRFKEYGVTKEIHVTADSAYEYPMPPVEYRKKLFDKLGLAPDGKPIIGIAPKEFFWWPIGFRPFAPAEDRYMWPMGHIWHKGSKESSQLYVEQSARHADWCAKTYDATIALISMEHMDLPPTQRIFDLMKHKDRAVIVSSDDYIVDDIISVLSILKALVTTRYHAAVLSSCSAIPMISVSSDTRCEAVFRELDIMDLYIDYVKHPDPFPAVKNLDEVLIEMTKNLMGRTGDLKKRIAKQHGKFVERARMNDAILEGWLKENFPA
jgi:polysaccharide pyruvyl transferase WcaK-like protein